MTEDDLIDQALTQLQRQQSSDFRRAERLDHPDKVAAYLKAQVDPDSTAHGVLYFSSRLLLLGNAQGSGEVPPLAEWGPAITRTALKLDAHAVAFYGTESAMASPWLEQDITDFQANATLLDIQCIDIFVVRREYILTLPDYQDAALRPPRDGLRQRPAHVNSTLAKKAR